MIGSGPSGWSAAFYLALNGVDVTIFEAKDVIGGMMRLVPVFRLPWEMIQRDVDRILDLGVKLELNHPITGAPEKLLEQGFDAVYVATGFQQDTPLRIPGVEGPGVYAALDLLDRTRRGERPDLGKKALVIGGGDTAMDAVRTSQRLTGNPTTIVYRRTRAGDAGQPRGDSKARWRKATSCWSSPRRCASCATPRARWWRWSACATSWASPAPTAAASRWRSRAASSRSRATR